MKHLCIFFALVACSAFALTSQSYGLVASSLEVVDASGRVVTASAVRTVVGWGGNQYGPLDVPENIGDVAHVAAGYYHSITVQVNGTVKVWAKHSRAVVDVPGDLGQCTAVAGGSGQVLALKDDGTVAAWGQSNSGQTMVPHNLRDVVSIAAGGWHSVALLGNGTIVSWGASDSGQQRIPAGLGNVTAIAAGAGNTAVLKRNGTVISWGNAIKIPKGLSNVIAIDAGAIHMLALKSDGTVVAWGNNEYGQCDVPAGLRDIESISGGSWHSIALKRDGTVAAWGDQDFGIPNGTTVPKGLSGVLAIDSGNSFSLALLEPGNDFGTRQLGETRHHNLFVKNSGSVALQNITAVIEGDYDSQFSLQPPATTTLPAGGKLPLTLHFTPTRLGPVRATLKIYSSALNSPLILPIKGVGKFQVTATSAAIPNGTFTYAPLRLERQTGLLLQKIAFSNTSGFRLQGLKLLLSNVASGVQVYSTSAGRAPGSLEAIYSQPIADKETISFDLVYFDPKRRTAESMNPLIKAEALLEPEPDSLPVKGTVVPLLRARSTPQGPTLEWNSAAGKTYVVEYSDDGGTTWLSAVHRLSTGGTRMFWLDRGQPETKTKPTGLPNQVGGRYYRVKRL
jgi:alpha-tubulin suppressor-like RCC1 family protein